MNVKIDTKEKFTVITPLENVFHANMTGKLEELLLSYTEKNIRHLILNMKNIEAMDLEPAIKLAEIQQLFYDKNLSFVICELKQNVESLLDSNEVLEIMNVTPTESEAWDIVQMEEIERELMADPGDDDLSDKT